MTRPPFLILHKTEWDRLRRERQPLPEESVNTKKKKQYIKALIEQSQEWMKTWPDSFAGRLDKIEKQKKKQQKANAEFIKAYKAATSKVKQENSTVALKEARQLIFEGSNYGRKLLSAILESRAIDEREAQIKFNKEVQKKAAEVNEDVTKIGDIISNGVNEERETQEKLKTLECIEVNKKIVLLKKEEELKEKLIEKQCAIEEKKLLEQVVEIEKKEKEDKKRCERLKLEEYEADTKKLAKIKENNEKLTDALIDAHKREQDRIKLKSRAVLHKVHQGRPDTKWSKNLYEKLKQIQSEENKRYEDFVDKGIKKYEQSNSKKDAKDRLQEKQKNSSRFLNSQMNKIAGQEIALAKKCENKCACDRQSLLMNITVKPVKKSASTATKSSDDSTTNIKNKSEKSCIKKSEQLPYRAPRNQLIEELRKREKEPSPWTAASGAHAQFARQADSALKEVKHKYFARKVVDEYRKLNCLDATSLPVPNY